MYLLTNSMNRVIGLSQLIQSTSQISVLKLIKSMLTISVSYSMQALHSQLTIHILGTYKLHKPNVSFKVFLLLLFAVLLVESSLKPRYSILTHSARASIPLWLVHCQSLRALLLTDLMVCWLRMLMHPTMSVDNILLRQVRLLDDNYSETILNLLDTQSMKKW